MTTVITAVPKEHIGNVWPTVSPWLDKAIDRTRGRYHSVDIITSLLEGLSSLWLAIRRDDDGRSEIIGSMVLTITLYPSGMRAGMINYIAGKDRDDWIDQIWDAACDYARDMGCDKIELVCRPGIKAYVERYGAKATGTFYEYSLGDRP